MQTKTNLLVFSLVTLLSLSVVTIGELPQAVADKDSNDQDHSDFKKYKKFSKRPHFETADCRVAATAMAPVVSNQLGITVNADGTLDGADCNAKAWFDRKTSALKYRIQINGMDVVDDDGNGLDDIGKMHFHKASSFMMNNPDNPMGSMHVLNIFRQPAMDDAQLTINPVQGILTGIWDDDDAVDRDGHHDDTFEVTDEFIQESLCQGEVFLMVHGQTDNNAGGFDKPGFIKAALQPTNTGEKLCEKKLKLSTDSDLLS